MEVTTLMQRTFTSTSEEDRRASELRSLEAYRLRLEHEARVADELVRIDVLARRLSSRPPPALASIPVPAPSATPPAMSSCRDLSFADTSSGGWPALTMDVLPEERPATTTSAPSKLSFVAAAVSVSALLSFIVIAFVLRPLPATADTGAHQTSHAASEPTVVQQESALKPAEAAGVTSSPVAHATCGTDAKEPALAASAPARTAKRASRASHATPSPSPSPAVTTASARAPAAAPAPQIEEAARTAKLLREQLGTTLR